MMSAELLAFAREAYGWGPDVTVSPGARGALGQMWRVDVGPARYALKEIFRNPPSETLVEAELALAGLASAAGVRLPASHPGTGGRHMLAAPDGTWVRLYDWVDMRPVDPAAADTPAGLGTLLATLHRCGPPMSVEPEGGPPDPWYHDVPGPQRWEAAAASDAVWAPRLVERLKDLPALAATVTPTPPDGLIACHRDLHPENILMDCGVDGEGALVVVDWDNLGPARPERETARMIFDWFCDGPEFDLDAVTTFHAAYVAAGGPGRVTDASDFSMLIAFRANFLLRQTQLATDPGIEPRHREWAEREIDEALRILPTPAQLEAVLTAVS